MNLDEIKTIKEALDELPFSHKVWTNKDRQLYEKAIRILMEDKMGISDFEMIARQAKHIEELREEIADLKNRIKNARTHIYCIGGPLNDNKLGYSLNQLITFQRINDELMN